MATRAIGNSTDWTNYIGPFTMSAVTVDPNTPNNLPPCVQNVAVTGTYISGPCAGANYLNTTADVHDFSSPAGTINVSWTNSGPCGVNPCTTSYSYSFSGELSGDTITGTVGMGHTITPNAGVPVPWARTAPVTLRKQQ